MKTQEITVAIKATVPVGDRCSGCNFYYTYYCRLFNIELNLHSIKKPKICLDACEAKDRALKELGE